MDPIISVEGLIKQYKDVIAVNNVSFDIQPGTCFGLLGPNGAGKTTTIEMMEGLTPPSKGQIKLFSKTLTKAALDQIGIQFQQTALQDFLTVTETINLFASFYKNTLATDTLITMCVEFIGVIRVLRLSFCSDQNSSVGYSFGFYCKVTIERVKTNYVNSRFSQKIMLRKSRINNEK